VVTAWHCLEYYDSLARPIRFTLYPRRGEPLARTARVLSAGGSMNADWAILRLEQPVPSSSVRALRIDALGPAAGARILMAGFSGDAGLGEDGRRLTYHAGCRITAAAADTATTDCIAYKGASGGAVVLAKETGEHLLYGVISAGDSVATSIFVPLTRFHHTLTRHLAR
jgi:hypothetical protein